MERIFSSFRDPSGFVFKMDGELFRQISFAYKNQYEHLMNSGLYKTLIDKNLLIPHEEYDYEIQPQTYKVIKPQMVDFISYPYEWSFSQLKDAALTTLEVLKISLDYNMILKDASAYNIQFHNGSPVFIDTLSFDFYEEGNLWDGYRQFCQHFFAPLAIMSYADFRLKYLMRDYIDGIPLDLASKLLPIKTKFNMAIFMHIHMHGKKQKQYSDKTNKNIKNLKLSKNALLGIIDNLYIAIKKMSWEHKDTEWCDYYNITNYSKCAFEEKKRLVSEFIKKAQSKVVWDLGANTGVFSCIASSAGAKTIAFDMDPAAVENNYQYIKKEKEKNILPLVMDLTNPSPSIGWALKERDSINQRAEADTVMVLALMHHLVISNNIPFDYLAEFLVDLAPKLIIEFIPKSDLQVEKLLSTRKDIFMDYNIEAFENCFENYYKIIRKEYIGDSDRILFLMEKIGNKTL